MPQREDQDELTESTKADRESPPVFRAEELFRSGKEIWIEHAGNLYRLRITRRNKLILQK